jgi:hypothetical protein
MRGTQQALRARNPSFSSCPRRWFRACLDIPRRLARADRGLGDISQAYFGLFQYLAIDGMRPIDQRQLGKKRFADQLGGPVPRTALGICRDMHVQKLTRSLCPRVA